MEAKKTLISQSNPKQKEQYWRYTKPDFKLYYRAIAQNWQENRHEDQRNRIEDRDTNAHRYSHLICDMGA
jgi:hypothetical protein